MAKPRQTYLTAADRVALQTVLDYLHEAEVEHDDEEPQEGHIRQHLDHIALMLRFDPRGSVLVPVEVQDAIRTKLDQRYGAYVLAAAAGITRAAVHNLLKPGATCQMATLEAVRAALGEEA